MKNIISFNKGENVKMIKKIINKKFKNRNNVNVEKIMDKIEILRITKDYTDLTITTNIDKDNDEAYVNVIINKDLYYDGTVKVLIDSDDFKHNLKNIMKRIKINIIFNGNVNINGDLIIIHYAHLKVNGNLVVNNIYTHGHIDVSGNLITNNIIKAFNITVGGNLISDKIRAEEIIVDKNLLVNNIINHGNVTVGHNLITNNIITKNKYIKYNIDVKCEFILSHKKYNICHNKNNSLLVIDKNFPGLIKDNKGNYIIKDNFYSSKSVEIDIHIGDDNNALIFKGDVNVKGSILSSKYACIKVEGNLSANGIDIPANVICNGNASVDDISSEEIYVTGNLTTATISSDLIKVGKNIKYDIINSDCEVKKMKR